MASTEFETPPFYFPLEKTRVLVHLVLLQVASKHPELFHVIAAPWEGMTGSMGTGYLKYIKP